MGARRVRGVALPFEFLVPRRREPSRGAGRGSGAARPGRARAHRPRRLLRRRAVRGSGAPARSADRVRRGDDARRPRTAERASPIRPASTWSCSRRGPSGTRVSPRRSARRSWRGRRARRARRSTTLADAARAPVHGHDASPHNDHWFVLTGCRKGTVPAALAARRPGGGRARAAASWSTAFGRDRVLVELWDHGDPLDRHRNDALAQCALRAGVEVIATNNVHYAHPGPPSARAGARRGAGPPFARRDRRLAAGRAVRAPAQRRPNKLRRFARWPGAVERTVEIARRVRVRPEARGAATARLPGAVRARRDVVVARARAAGRGRLLPAVARAVRAGDAPDRLRAAR